MGVTMAVTTRDALLDTQQAFDGVASMYDQSNETNPIIRWMRARTIGAVRAVLPAGSHVLDLGCGPGRDAATLAAAGYRVTATDWSPAMVGQTLQRVTDQGLEGRVHVRHIGIHQLDRLDTGPFDGAYSDLGPLNCVPDLRQAAASIAAQLRPGGVLIASVIGRLCPWELALYTVKAQWTRATMRFEPGLVAVPLDGQRVWTRYWWPTEFTDAFAAAGFTCESLAALGLFAPPPYLDHLAARYPRALAALERIDDTIGHWPLLRHGGDHFLIVLRKR